MVGYVIVIKKAFEALDWRVRTHYVAHFQSPARKLRQL